MPGGTTGRWTNEEHDLFIAGLNACGKGAWKAIAEEFVKTRNAEQVRIHAQKYYARQGRSQAKAGCEETAAPGVPSSVKEGHWTEEEHELFLKAWAKYGKCWKKISEVLKTRTNEQIRTHAQKYFQKLNELKCWGFAGAYAMDGTRHLTKGFMSEQVAKGVVETQALPPVKADKIRTQYSHGSSEGSSDSPCGSVQGDPNMPFPLGDGLGGPYVMAAAPVLQEQPQQHMHPPMYHHLLPSPIPMHDLPPPPLQATGPMMAQVGHVLVGPVDAGGAGGVMVMNGDAGGVMQAPQGHVQISTAHVPLPHPPPILMPPPMHSHILHHPHPLHPISTHALHTPAHAVHTPINTVRSPRPLKLTSGGNKPVYVTRTGRVVSRRRKTEDELYFDDDDDEGEDHGELGDGLGLERGSDVGAMVMVNGEVVPGYGEYERKTPSVLMAQTAYVEAAGDAALLLPQQHQPEHTSPPPLLQHRFDLHQPHHEHALQPPPQGCMMGVAAGVPMDSPQWVDMTSHFDDASRKRTAADGVIDEGDHIHQRAHKVMRADDAVHSPLQHIHHEHMAHMHVHHHNGEEVVVGAALTCPDQPHLPPLPLDYHRSHSLPLSEMHIEPHAHDGHEYHHLAHPHDDVHHHGGHGKGQGVHVHVHGGGHHHGHEDDDDVLHHHELMQLHHELDDHDPHEHHHHHDPHHLHHNNHHLHALTQHHTADGHHEEAHHAYVRQAPLDHHRVVVPADTLHLECHEVSPSVEHASNGSPDMGGAIDDGSSTHSLAISSGGVDDVGLHVPGMMKMGETGDGGQGVGAGNDGAENSLAGPDVHVDGEGSEVCILSLGSGLVSHGDE